MKKIITMIICLMFSLIVVGCASSEVKVYFNSNGGSDVDTMTVNENDLIDAPKTTRNGYAFNGWYKDSGLTELWDFENDRVEKTITLYAGWLKLFTVTFDTRGGSEIESQEVKHGGLVSKPADPTKEDSLFLGWVKDTDTEEAWDFRNHTVEENLTLYALWADSEKLIVKFDSRGGSEITSKAIDPGSPVSKPSDPTRDGYEFLGWFDEELKNEWNFNNVVTKNMTLYAKWNAVGRVNPDYYTPGVPLIEDAHVLYMNFDGFARYYYDELVDAMTDEGKMPNLKKIIEDGVFLENLRTTLPSITNPCQNMILSGATSAITKNVYRYYDKNTNEVIQQERQNATKLISEVALEANMRVASVHHYLMQPHLTSTDVSKIYITSDNSIPAVVARGEKSYSDFFARFEQLTRLVKGEPLKVNTGATSTVTVNKLPQLMVYYSDDLDAIGHNEKDNYSYTRQDSEAKRMNNVLTCLRDIDAKLGDFIAACKEANVYDKITFFITTDHGMTPFGRETDGAPSKYTYSKLGDLRDKLKSINNTYQLGMVAANTEVPASINVVAVGANLNLQLTWKNGITDDVLDYIKTELEKEDYIYKVLTRKELAAMGYWVHDTDMIISPAERYCFSAQPLAAYSVRGQHDSMQDSANRIVGWIFGKGIKKNHILQDEAYNYDFGTTMAAALGLVLPEANGIVLDVFDIE